MKRPATALRRNHGQSRHLIRDTRVFLTAVSRAALRGSGILCIRFPLRILYANEGITQRELGRMLSYGDAHAGVIVAFMQRMKLVDRRPNGLDKRRIDLYLTPAGRRWRADRRTCCARSTRA